MACFPMPVEQSIIVSEVFIAAPPARVFDAISDPNQMPRWWSHREVYRIVGSMADVRTGGRWSSAGIGPDGEPVAIHGEDLEVDAPRLLVQTWVPSWTDAVSTVRWELQEHAVHGLHPRGPRKAGTGTLVSILQETLTGSPVPLGGQREGWTRVLGWLQTFVETGDTLESRLLS